MTDMPSSPAFDLDVLAERLGAPPEAPLAMPKQVLEAERPGRAGLALLAVRLFGARLRPGH